MSNNATIFGNEELAELGEISAKQFPRYSLSSQQILEFIGHQCWIKVHLHLPD